MKNTIKLLLTFILFVHISGALAQTFNKSTDLLLANFDLKPDDDDVHAAAALGCMLKHADFEGVNFYAVAGAYGDQDTAKYKFISTAVPDFFNTLFGPENENWTNADGDWSASVIRATDEVVKVLTAGGKVFVQEAGQSDFTYDVLHAAMGKGIALATIASNVILVQHSNWNINNTTTSKMDWIKANVVYVKIADGNTSDNGTPNYKSTETQWMTLAMSADNPNVYARTYWTMAADICEDWTVYNNKAIKGGGVDFSDGVELWQIFNLATLADDLTSFWNRYVTNELTEAVVDHVEAQERSENPFVTHMYTADPSAHVWDDGRLYVYPSTDLPKRGYAKMDGYHVFSTDDMVTWKDHGEILNSDSVEWGRKEGGFMWAPDCAYRDGVYYYYFPHPSGTDYRKTWKIGVATSTSPTSGFKEQGYIKGILPLIDPCVFIDDDEQAYLYHGNPNKPYGVKLKENMVEIDGEPQKLEGLTKFKEGLWVFKRNDIYYAIYPDFIKPYNQMNYAMSDNPLGPFTHKGVFLEGTGVITTHGSIVEYKGQWYLFYHNGALSGGMASNRSICFDKVYFNGDGTINMVVQTLGSDLPIVE